VVAVVDTLVATFIAVTCTPANTAALGSLTVPVIDPRSDCAETKIVDNNTINIPQ
jgi:hypothetical protein